MGLTVKGIAKTTAAGRYRDDKGLYLQVTKTGAKSWVLRYEREGKERMMGLGPLHAFTLEEARERARLARQKLADGIDPLADRERERSERELAKSRVITFKDAAEGYFEMHKGRWKNEKHAAQFLSTLEAYAYPTIAKLSVADIDTAHIIEILDPIWATKNETASRVRGRIENVLAWSTIRGHRTGDNPARWQGHLSTAMVNGKRQVRNHPALPYGEVGTFVSALRQREGIAARALEFAILTAARTGEIIGATWSEVDLDEAVWTVPAGRMKARKEHRVPLMARAVEILRNMPREGDIIFVGAKKDTAISNMSMAAVLKRMGVEPQRATVHGFRSTFRDWAAEQTAYPSDVVEMALAHTIKNKVEAAYRRGDLFDKRQRLMEEWANFCATASGTGSNVTPIREAL